MGGSKPEPPKIPSEKAARDVSGSQAYPTRFSAHVLAMQVGGFSLWRADDGKQLFADNPRQCWLCEPDGKIWVSGLEPQSK